MKWSKTYAVALLMAVACGHKAAVRTVTGNLSKEEIRSVIHAHRGEVEACFVRELAAFPHLQGKVTIRFVITKDGSVPSATVAQSEVGDDALGLCTAEAVRTWQFPPPRGDGIVIVTFPFIFKTGAAGAEDEAGAAIQL